MSQLWMMSTGQKWTKVEKHTVKDEKEFWKINFHGLDNTERFKYLCIIKSMKINFHGLDNTEIFEPLCIIKSMKINFPKFLFIFHRVFFDFCPFLTSWHHSKLGHLHFKGGIFLTTSDFTWAQIISIGLSFESMISLLITILLSDFF